MEEPSGYEAFAADLRELVLSKADDDSEQQFREEAFTEFVHGLLYEHGLANDADICHSEVKSVGSKPAGKISAWALSADGTLLDLFVSMYHGHPVEETPTLSKTDIQKQLNFGIGFHKRCVEGLAQNLEESSPGFLAAKAIWDARQTIATLNLYFLTDGLARSQDIKERDTVDDVEVQIHVWDIEKLSRLRPNQHEVIRVDFAGDYSKHGGAVPCLEMADPTGEYRTYLAFLPAPMLAQIYGQHGQRLLERNVRAFLQAKGKVNKGLQKTLKEEPHRFLAYNNGLCCTAAEVGVSTPQNGLPKLEWALDFQIVNGGQTTASLFYALKNTDADLNQVTVQVKLTVLSNQELASEFVPLISQYANSQNKINTADFFANGKYHIELEKLSRTEWAPAASGIGRGTRWYYERARGSYGVDKARQGTVSKQKSWAEQHPKEQMFDKTDLAKFINAWDGLPHMVCRGGEKNFQEFARRIAEEAEPIVDLTYFHRLAAKAIIWNTAVKLFKNLGVKHYGSNSVAYTVAWLAYKSDHRIDLDRIWEQQGVSAPLSNALSNTLRAAHEFISSQPGNQNEFSKKEECWKKFREQNIAIESSWTKEWTRVPIIDAVNSMDAVEQEWDRLRSLHATDEITVGQMEAVSSKKAPAKMKKLAFYEMAALPAAALRKRFGLGPTQFRNLVEVVSAAERLSVLSGEPTSDQNSG